MPTALDVRRQGRQAVRSDQYKGWQIEVYRVGRRHEYQAIAENSADLGTVLQTARFGGPGSMMRAHWSAVTLIDTRGPLFADVKP
jgi:hypothetical protein